MESILLGTGVSESDRERTGSDGQRADGTCECPPSGTSAATLLPIVQTAEEWKQLKNGADARGDGHDAGRPRPTTHLHRQGAKVEDAREREQMWKSRVRRAVGCWIRHLDTRVDLTLKTYTRVPIPDGSEVPISRRPKTDGARGSQARVLSKVTTKRLNGRTGTTATMPTGVCDQVTGDSVPSVWIRVNEEMIERDINNFMKKLNRLVLRPRRSAPYRPRLNAFVVLEYSPTGRPHVHALIERPSFLSVPEFAEFVRHAWSRRPSAHGQYYVRAAKNTDASLIYNTKAADAWSNVKYQHVEPDATAYWRHDAPGGGADDAPAGSGLANHT